MRYGLEHLAVGFGAISGVLAARGRQIDLFGVLVLAFVTAAGGGTLRDLVLDRPVFWLEDSSFVMTAFLCGLTTFAVARVRSLPQRWLLIADAFSLAFVTMLGTAKSLNLQVHPINAVLLGVVTGVAGGIIRDVLCSEVPLVFRREIYLYATAAAVGAVALCVLRWSAWWVGMDMVLGAAVVLCLRLAAIRWRLALPLFEAAEDGNRSV